MLLQNSSHLVFVVIVSPDKRDTSFVFEKTSCVELCRLVYSFDYVFVCKICVKFNKTLWFCLKRYCIDKIFVSLWKEGGGPCDNNRFLKLFGRNVVVHTFILSISRPYILPIYLYYIVVHTFIYTTSSIHSIYLHYVFHTFYISTLRLPYILSIYTTSLSIHYIYLLYDVVHTFYLSTLLLFSIRTTSTFLLTLMLFVFYLSIGLLCLEIKTAQVFYLSYLFHLLLFVYISFFLFLRFITCLKCICAYLCPSMIFCIYKCEHSCWLRLSVSCWLIFLSILSLSLFTVDFSFLFLSLCFIYFSTAILLHR